MKKIIERACIVSLLLIMFFAKDTELIGLDGAVTETMEKDLQETIQLLAIFQLADWKGVKVLDGMIVENRLQELRQIKSKIDDQLRFRDNFTAI